MILVIDKKDIIIRYKTASIYLERDNKQLQRVPIKQLALVVIYGNPMADVTVWRYLAFANVPVVMLASRGKQQSATITGTLATQLPFRRLQHKIANDQKNALNQAAYFLKLKFNSYTLSLTTLKLYYPVKDDELESFVRQQKRTIEKLESPKELYQLMGLEGQLAQAWFALLAKSLPYHLKFAGRNRRPPRDPMNSLLSLGYTLLGAEIHQLLIASGLDPSLGFLHQDSPGRESLVLDFIEIFRSGVDSFALQWLATTELDDSSFYFREEQGCRLSKATRPIFFKAWANYRQQWQQVIQSKSVDKLEEWPTGQLREQVIWQIMQWREHLKNCDRKSGKIDSEFKETRK